jgi:hypothetical protein
MAKYGEQLNEALTEFFTKEMCARLSVPDAVGPTPSTWRS